MQVLHRLSDSIYSLYIFSIMRYEVQEEIIWPNVHQSSYKGTKNKEDLKKYLMRGLVKPKISWQRKCLYSTMLALREREGRSM